MKFQPKNRMAFRILVGCYLIYLGVSQFRTVLYGDPAKGALPVPVMVLFGLLFTGVGAAYAWFGWKAMRQESGPAEDDSLPGKPGPEREEDTPPETMMEQTADPDPWEITETEKDGKNHRT